MGMSASQARLLSITGRLTNNEFRAQTITNAKLRNAEKSAEASDAYIAAMDSKELLFMGYDNNGDLSKYNLTPAVLYDYAPMKNQYLLVNQSNKFLISNLDAKNFEETDDLFKFLEKYNLTYDVTPDLNEKRMADFKAKRDADYAKYLKEHEQWEKDYADWEALVENWDETHKNTSLYDKFSEAVGKSEDYVNKPESQLPTDGRGCYAHALNPHDANSASCYLHVLGHLLDYDGTSGANKGPYKTITGDTCPNFNPFGYMSHQVDPLMIECSEAINEKDANGNYTRLCDTTDDYQGINGVENRLEKAKTDHDAGNISDLRWKIEQLVSDYYYDASGNMKVKSLRQKIIDLAYLTLNWGPQSGPPNEEWNNPDDSIAQAAEQANGGIFPASEISRKEMVDILINFTDGDLKSMSSIEPPDPPIEPVWIEPEPPEPLAGIVLLKDQEKSQWYTNMWHALNGSDTSNTVDPINFDSDVDYIQSIPSDIKAEYRFIVENKTKDTKQTNYTLFDQNLYGSAEWLEFALEHGVVTMTQAQYYNPDEDDNKTPNSNADGFAWNRIVYTSARDIVSSTDQNALANAEVIYKNTIAKLENEDNKLDQELKKLDAEHSALQTEYESIKQVISKNTERSFKAFS